jgi:hypothetical protein
VYCPVGSEELRRPEQQKISADVSGRNQGVRVARIAARQAGSVVFLQRSTAEETGSPIQEGRYAESVAGRPKQYIASIESIIESTLETFND